MSRRRRKRYYFSDSSIALDTIIAFAMGGLALAAEIGSVISSIATAGHVSGIVGLLLFIALILSVVGFLFSRFALKSEKGSLGGKRASSILNIFTALIPMVFLLMSV
ncbi:MAG: hypothetical protein IKO61_08090 [Lachnospiraceae bacterium]|nr:hypothetical protein [Lachnospiraceae bacterium]